MSDVADASYEWVVIHDQTGKSEGATSVSVETCYHDRDPYGEYIYFVASDPDAISNGRISIFNYAYLAEARVTFEADLVEEGLSSIAWCVRDFEEQGNQFATDIWPSWQNATLADIADSIFPPGQDYLMAKSVLLVKKDRACWVELTRIEADEPAEMALTFARAEQDRLIEIKAVMKIDDVPVGVLSGMWETMVGRFENLPYEKLTGAKRLEPEDEDEFDIDTIGDVAGEA